MPGCLLVGGSTVYEFRFVLMIALLMIILLPIQPPGLDMTPEDPRWIGAWWLGYFFGGLLLLLSAIALLGYPREMPGARELRYVTSRDDNW